MEKLQYPIGRFQKPQEITNAHIAKGIEDIASFPERLTKAVQGLNNEQLDTPYRPEGWTIRQVVHHCADSHMNSMIRFKWALTENKPVIKAYFEERWAELADTKTLDVTPSLKILNGLHTRWTTLLNNLTENQLEREFIHPESGASISLKENILIYAWHCNHHLAHITSLKNRKNWS